MKFLVGITPSGVISFVSEAWGGRASDSHITINSGLLDLLDENDTVMADKGFLIEDALGKIKCKLVIPPFRGATPQFTTDQVFDTQEIARRRIHVERSIGRVKTFHILDGVFPLTLAPLATQIFQVCSLLTNFYVVYNSFSILACIGLIVVVTSHSVTWSGALSGMASQRCRIPTIYNI